MSSSKQSFIKGAVILAAAGVISKILGAIYRIPLGQLIKSEGMGYYQTAYLIYILLLNFSSSVIPVAISKLVSEKIGIGRRDEAHRIFKVSLVMLTCVGLVLSGILFLFAGKLVHLLKNPGAYLSVLAVAPALFTVSLSGAFRGYFQGMQNMTPSAVSQVTEQIARVGIGFILVFIFLPLGNTQAAAGAIFGTTVGGLISFLTLLLLYKKRRPEILSGIRDCKGLSSESTASIISKIVKFSIPITIGGSIMPIMGLVDVFIVMDRLQAAGFSQIMSNSLYGQLTGMATSFINLPQVFTIALAASLVPTISESIAKNDHEAVSKKSELGIRISLLIGLPAAMGLFILADPIMTMIYPNETNTLGMALKYLAPSVIFLTLVQTLTGILQGMGKQNVPVVNMIIGAGVKLVISYTLTSIPSLNIRGAAIGTVVGYAVSTVLNLRSLMKYQSYGMNFFKITLKPLTATAAMAAAAYFSYRFIFIYTMKNSLATLISMILAALVYAIVLILIKGVTEEELALAPGGKRLSSTLKKRGLIK